MATRLNFDGNIHTATLIGELDEIEGRELENAVRKEVPQGGKLIIFGAGLSELTTEGLLHLMNVQRWTNAPRGSRLPLAGFPSAARSMISEKGVDSLFDFRSTLEESLHSLGGPAGTSAPEPVHPDWSQHQQPATDPRRSVRRWAAWIGALALALVLAEVAAWWYLRAAAPELTVTVSTLTVEEEGNETDGVEVDVRHGKLDEKSWEGLLPKGLYFQPTADEGSRHNVYALRGAASVGATSSTVRLQALGADGKRSAPVAFTVEVKAKPLSWQLITLQSLGLTAGTPITARSKFVAGAENATADGLPDGLQVERCPGTARDWQLAGIPAAAGKYEITFHAVSQGKSPETRSCSLDIASGEFRSASGKDALTPSASVKQATGDRTPGSPPTNLGNGLRSFLLERIERLPARYTEEDRENLRTVVNGLRQATLIRRVVFERDGQTDLSPEQAAKLKEALQSPDNARLLAAPDCQLVIVGYASKTGSLAANTRYSRLRARAVETLVKGTLGRNADLCGDYGPTDVLDRNSDQTNRAVEVYAGTMDVPPRLRAKAAAFKDDFNRRHGVR